MSEATQGTRPGEATGSAGDGVAQDERAEVSGGRLEAPVAHPTEANDPASAPHTEPPEASSEVPVVQGRQPAPETLPRQWTPISPLWRIEPRLPQFSLTAEVWVALDWAGTLRQHSSLRVIDSTLLLGGILLYAQHSGPGMARFLLDYLLQQGPGTGTPETTTDLVLDLLGGTGLTQLPDTPETLPSDALLTAEAENCLRVADTQFAPSLAGTALAGMSEVIAAILCVRPRPTIRQVLVDRGFDMDDLRSALYEYVRLHPRLVSTFWGPTYVAASVSTFEPVVGMIDSQGVGRVSQLTGELQTAPPDIGADIGIDSVQSIRFVGTGNAIVLTRQGNLRTWPESRELEGVSRVMSLATCQVPWRIAVGTESGEAFLWDRSGNRDITGVRHAAAIHAMELTPDGTVAASASLDGAVMVWTPSGESFRTVLPGLVVSMALTRDGRYLATGTNGGTATVWEVETGRQLRRMEHDGPVVAIAFVPDERTVVSGSLRDSTKVWDATSGRRIAEIPQAGLRMAVDPGRKLVALAGGTTVQIEDAATAKAVAVLDHGVPVTGVAYAPNGQIVTTALDGQLRGWFPVDAPTLERWRGVLGVSAAGRSVLAGYRPDDLSGPDTLGIGNDVKNLCAVLAAQDVEPPLSVGLFGDWGTGKSYFMQLMRHQIKEFAREGRATREAGKKQFYCAEIRQITFNAWNYSDANLWASLVSRIFEGLATDDPDRNPPSPAEDEQRGLERERLLKNLQLTQQELREAQRQEAAAKEEEKTAHAERDAVQKALEQTQNQRQLVTERDLVEAAEQDPLVQTAKAQLEQRLGERTGLNDQDLQQLATLPTTLGELKSEWRHLDGKLRNDFLWWTAVVVAAAGIIGSIVAFLLIRHAGLLETAVGTAAAVIATLERGFRWMARRLRDIAVLAGQTRAFLERARVAAEERQTREITELDTRVAALTANHASAQRDVTEKENAVTEATARVEDIQVGRRLSRFIQERSASSDYRQHLGILALVRRDFESLIWLLNVAKHASTDEEARKAYEAAGTPDLPSIDRIILYIDDLDRCAPSLVVDVLQAVHLLLALPLFVVVVGVDSRWLLRSLERHYSELLTSPQREPNEEEEAGGGDQHWMATPQNYLEKIFQIPYTLPRMTPEGFGQLVEWLISKKEGEAKHGEADRGDTRYSGAAGMPDNEMEESATFETAQQPVPSVGPESHSTRSELESRKGKYVSRDTVGPAAATVDDVAAPIGEGQPKVQPSGKDEVEPSTGETMPKAKNGGLALPIHTIEPEALEIQDLELQYMKKLAPLIDTPRSAKRLVNVYRLLRVSLSKADLRKLMGLDHQAALTLLAILIGFPGPASEIFPALLQQKAARSWNEFVVGLLPEGPGNDGRYGNSLRKDLTPEESEVWKRLCDGLNELRAETSELQLEQFQRWVRPVARYSFRPGREIYEAG
jgi:hypothetical protein